MGCWKEDCSGKMLFSSHHLERGMLCKRLITVDVDLDHLADAVLVRFLHWEVTLRSLPSRALLSRGKSHIQPTLQGGGKVPPPSRWSIYVNYLEFFCGEGLSVLPYFKNISIWPSVLTWNVWIFVALQSSILLHGGSQLPCSSSWLQAWVKSPNQRSNHFCICQSDSHYWDSGRYLIIFYIQSMYFHMTHQYFVYTWFIIQHCFSFLLRLFLSLTPVLLWYPKQCSPAPWLPFHLCISTRLDRTFDTETEPQELKPWPFHLCVLCKLPCLWGLSSSSVRWASWLSPQWAAVMFMDTRSTVPSLPEVSTKWAALSLRAWLSETPAPESQENQRKTSSAKS